MRILVATVVGAVALAASGCGGSDSEDATAAWAGGLCTALQTWSTSLQAASAALQDTSSLSPETIGGALEDVVDATATLADDVQALGQPEIDAADEARQTVTELADTLQSDAATLQGTLDEAGSGLAGLLEQISTITQTLGSMTTAVGQAFTELQSLDAQGELEDAFEAADSCDALTSS